MLPAALSVAEAAAELAEDAADERAEVAEEPVSLASALVAVAEELPDDCEEPEEVEMVALEELELELYCLAALHQETLVCSAPKRLGSEG